LIHNIRNNAASELMEQGNLGRLSDMRLIPAVTLLLLTGLMGIILFVKLVWSTGSVIVRADT
jgi:hypothetical protein